MEGEGTNALYEISHLLTEKADHLQKVAKNMFSDSSFVATTESDDKGCDN